MARSKHLMPIREGSLKRQTHTLTHKHTNSHRRNRKSNQVCAERCSRKSFSASYGRFSQRWNKHEFLDMKVHSFLARQ